MNEEQIKELRLRLSAVDAYMKRFPALVPVGAWEYVDRKTGELVDGYKVPLFKGWQSDPVTNPNGARQVFARYANRYSAVPNLGLVTGQINGGYIVIDIDRHSEIADGYETLLDWQLKTAHKLPETWRVLTGSGGYHFYYRTDRAMRGYSNTDLGVDLRADGNFVVLPPSVHRNGNRYEWEVSAHDMPCAEADEAVYEFIEYCRPSGSQYQRSTQRGQGGERKMALPPEIPEGGRHDPLISLIGTLNRLGVSDEAIETAIRIENAAKCKPPLTEGELQHEIFPAIYRWEKGVPAEGWIPKEDYLAQQRQERKKQQALKLFQS